MTTTMLAKGICLRGDGEEWRNLQRLARQYYDIGPNLPSASEIRKLGDFDETTSRCGNHQLYVRLWGRLIDLHVNFLSSHRQTRLV